MLTQVKNKIRISAGTAAVLGLSRIKQLHPPSTAYFMIGERCLNSCLFCSQSGKSSASSSFLSRVAWPQFDFAEVLDKLNTAAIDGRIKRICFQIVNAENSKKDALDIMGLIIKNNINVQISVSTNILDLEFIEKAASYADNVSIPLDAATKELYKINKGRGWNESWLALEHLAEKYPGKAATHLILGLGETEEEAITLLYLLHSKNINAGLFAFTPLKGTALSDAPAPELRYYRKIQLAYYLIKLNALNNFEFENGALLWRQDIKKTLENDMKNKEYKYKEAFMTSGCAFCTRPYYNERAGKVPYNYPSQLTDEEYIEAAELALGCRLA